MTSKMPENMSVQNNVEAPLFLFTRKSKRSDVTYTIPAGVLQSLITIEKGLRCDCYILVTEGRIPAHSVLMNNATTIGAAFASSASESVSMTFDMRKWKTEHVLDIIELLYTNSMQHFKPLQLETVFTIFEMLLFLGHPDAQAFLYKVMGSAMVTLGAQYNKNLKSTLFQDNLGVVSTDQCDVKVILCQSLWILTEGLIPTVPKEVLDGAIEMFCRSFFIPKLNDVESFRDVAHYFCCLSLTTVRSIIQHCLQHCKEWDWNELIYFIRLWILFDPVDRLEGITLLKNLCFENVHPELQPGTIKQIHEFVYEIQQQNQLLDDLRAEGVEISALSPFSTPIAYQDRDIAHKMPTPVPHEMSSAKKEVLEYTYDMLKLWIKTAKQLPDRKGGMCPADPSHVCSNFTS